MTYSIGACLILIFAIIGFVYAFYLFLYQCDIIDEEHEKFVLEEKKKKCKIDYTKHACVNKFTHEEVRNYVAKSRLEALRKRNEEEEKLLEEAIDKLDHNKMWEVTAENYRRWREGK